MEELGRRAGKELDVPWDDLRHARVRDRVRRDWKDGRALGGWRRGQDLWRWAGAAVVLVAVAMAALLGGLRTENPAPVVTVAPVLEPAMDRRLGPEVRAENALSLADGSRVVMLREAEVSVVSDDSRGVRLRHEAGRVRYEVMPRERTPFVVEAGEVEVRVVGTVFVVDVEPRWTTVEVSEGRVEVRDAEDMVTLESGEQLRLRPNRELAPTDQVVPHRAEKSEAKPASTPGALENVRSRRPRSSAAKLMARADAARAVGDLVGAIRALQQLVREHPTAPRAPQAWMTLGRLERQRGRPIAASQAFRHVFEQARSHPLAEDAMGEAAQALATAGKVEEARRAAERYLARYPSGIHRDKMRSLLGR